MKRKKKKFGPEAIHDVDKIEITTVHKPEKNVAMKGEKQIFQVTLLNVELLAMLTLEQNGC